MRGISLKIVEYGSKLELSADPLLCNTSITADDVIAFIHTTEFAYFSLVHTSIQNLCDELSGKQQLRDVNPIVGIVGIQNMIVPVISVSSDNMQATVSLTGQNSNESPTEGQIINALKDLGIKRGISKKVIAKLVAQIGKADNGETITEVVAKGLPAKRGRDSYVKPLVPNVLEKLLQPKRSVHLLSNIQSLSETLLVATGQAVAQVIPPTTGRDGFTIKNEKILAEKGHWTDITLGENTLKSAQNPNIIISRIAGQPKFVDGRLSVHRALIYSDIESNSDNIDFDGAVIVDGNVVQGKQIIATGDIVVNGFVESALLRAGGDISIMQGASGTMDENDCQLFANGNIFIHHGQGLEIVCGNHLQALKQLAYSNVVCRGRCTIGQAHLPDGALFASTIKAYDTVNVGVAGAVSSSKLSIDFTDGYAIIAKRLEAVEALRHELQSSNQKHLVHFQRINKKIVPPHLLDKINALDNALGSERELLDWILTIEAKLKADINNFTANAQLIARSELYPGVSVRLNEHTWEAKEEHLSSKVIFENNQWHFRA